MAWGFSRSLGRGRDFRYTHKIVRELRISLLDQAYWIRTCFK